MTDGVPLVLAVIRVRQVARRDVNEGPGEQTLHAGLPAFGVCLLARSPQRIMPSCRSFPSDNWAIESTSDNEPLDDNERNRNCEIEHPYTQRNATLFPTMRCFGSIRTESSERRRESQRYRSSRAGERLPRHRWQTNSQEHHVESDARAKVDRTGPQRKRQDLPFTPSFRIRFSLPRPDARSGGALGQNGPAPPTPSGWMDPQ